MTIVQITQPMLYFDAIKMLRNWHNNAGRLLKLRPIKNGKAHGQKQRWAVGRLLVKDEFVEKIFIEELDESRIFMKDEILEDRVRMG